MIFLSCSFSIDRFFIISSNNIQEMLHNKTEISSSEETTTTEPIEEIQITTAKITPETVEEDFGDSDADIEIEKLRAKVKLLREKGNRIKDAIIEQTKLLLSEESLLSRLRNRIVLNSLRNMRNKGNKKTVTLPKRQRQFLISLQGLESLLNDLRDANTGEDLQQRRKVKKIKLSLPEKKIREGKDSILDHPTIIGVDTLNEELEDYEDIPTIIVEEAVDTEPDTIVVKDYELDLDPIPEGVLVAVPDPAELPRHPPNLHGHVLRRPHTPHYHHTHYHEPYNPPSPPQQYHEPYYNPPTPPPQYHYPYESRPHIPEPYSPPRPRHYPAYPPQPLASPLLHRPGPPPPPPPEPHITLTGELLAGFEHINGHFINA